MENIYGKKKNAIEIWGDGSVKREIIYVDDIAKACVFFMKKSTKENLINIGSGVDYSIKYYANLMLKLLHPNKNIKLKFDKKKPNGTPRKVMDITLAKKYGWRPTTKLKDAILKTYSSYLKEYLK